jgi:hypothetical protein
MKKFKNNAELSHAYANCTHEAGKGHNMYFIDNVMYSYGTHYEIAHRTHAINGVPVIFVNENGYSSTTAKHTNHVWQAIPDRVHAFKVPFVKPSASYGHCNYFKPENLPAIIERMALNVRNHCTDQINARSYFGHYAAASSLYVDIMAICGLFDLECPPRPENWNEAENKANLLRATVKEREKIAEQKKLEKNRELLSKWMNNEYNGQLYDIPVHLRVSKCGQFIDTTKGARVTMDQAKVLLSRIKAGHDVKGYNLEGFTVIENTPEHIKIGCHLIKWDAINTIF